MAASDHTKTDRPLDTYEAERTHSRGIVSGSTLHRNGGSCPPFRTFSPASDRAAATPWLYRIGAALTCRARKPKVPLLAPSCFAPKITPMDDYKKLTISCHNENVDLMATWGNSFLSADGSFYLVCDYWPGGTRPY
jgi:hypothetical protein